MEIARDIDCAGEPIMEENYTAYECEHFCKLNPNCQYWSHTMKSNQGSCIGGKRCTMYSNCEETATRICTDPVILYFMPRKLIIIYFHVKTQRKSDFPGIIVGILPLVTHFCFCDKMFFFEFSEKMLKFFFNDCKKFSKFF